MPKVIRIGSPSNQALVKNFIPWAATSEELEFILAHEEPGKVLKIGSITYYGQYYRVPDDYIGKRVWIGLKGETLFVESAKKVIAQYPVKHDRLDEPR